MATWEYLTGFTPALAGVGYYTGTDASNQFHDSTTAVTSIPTYNDTTYISPPIDWTQWYPTSPASTFATIYLNPWDENAKPETRKDRRRRLKKEKAEALRQAIAHQKYLEKQRKLEEEQKAAVARAEELLKSHIGLERFGELYRVGHIEMDSRRYPGRKYRIKKEARALIEILEGDKVVDRLCVHPIDCFQSADEILTRIVLLDYAEEHILKTANHNRVYA